MGLRGHTKGPRQITARPHAKSHLPIFLCLSETRVQASEPVSLPPKGQWRFGARPPCPLPAPLFLAQRDPAQEGNVCVSAQALVVWPFPFAARVSCHRL